MLYTANQIEMPTNSNDKQLIFQHQYNLTESGDNLLELNW